MREYSALIDAPRNAPIAAGPVIQAPQVAMPSTVTRPPVVSTDPVAAAPESSVPVEAPPTGTLVPTPPPVAAQPDPDTLPVAPPPVAIAAAPVEAAPDPASTAGEYGPVKAGETLSEIARRVDGGNSLDQTMVALLRANPDAFIGEDINFIKRGAVLRVPQAAEISNIPPAEASVLVQAQLERWRDARRPAPQPVQAAISDTASAPSSAGASTPGTRRVADARLEIVPSAGNRGTQAGTRSGASAGGEGEMLRQQLQQNNEDLAARDAEVVELKARIAELETLQQQQGQLITLKDSELAAAQQRLAESNRLAAASPPGATASATGSAATAPETTRDMGWLWPLGIVLLVLAAFSAWWFSRRRRVTEEPARRAFNTESLAASFPAPAPSPAGVGLPADVAGSSDAPGKPARAARRTAAGNGRGRAAPAAVMAPVASVPESAAPPTVDPATQIAPAMPAPTWTAAGHATPTWHSGDAQPSPRPVSATLAKAALGQESIELARAYIDLGDDATARSLLQEVIDIGDAEARGTAAKMLRELP